MAAYARGVSVVLSAVAGVQDCINAHSLQPQAAADASHVSIDLTGPRVANTTAGAQMHEDDFCRTSAAAFDRLAERYAEKYFRLDLYARYLERFAARIEPDASVIDAACGPGNVSAHLAKLRPDLQLVGVDLAAGMIAQAKLRVPRVES
jgi:tRNA/tmRNA/rRNA uracil-C5-methylase (TrmA/RlmC/RlmD family)